VAYTNGKGNNWKNTEPASFKKIAVANVAAHRLYQVNFTGLVPGSIFSYRVIKNNTVVFETTAHAAKSKEQPYRFIVFGDVGAGTKEAKEIATAIYSAKADLVLIPGDIVYNAGPDLRIQ
jgi:phosphodiesterase/alkaline phosphatase D-like protein